MIHRTTHGAIIARQPHVAEPARFSAIQSIFIQRASHAIEHFALRADKATLADAVGAPTDTGMLIRVLRDAAVLGPSVADLDPEAIDLAKEIEHCDALLRRAGGTYSVTEVAQLLGISRQAVDKRRQNGALLAMRQSSDWHYPRAQFHERETLPNLPEVVKGMAETGPWVTLEFLVTPDTVLLGLTPREALLKGGAARDQAMMSVRGYAYDGFS